MPGDDFAVLTCGSRSGGFASATGLADLGGYAGLDFVLSYGSRKVVLEAAAIGGDANLDAAVNVFDLAILGNHYGAAGRVWTDGDFTGEGEVDVFDLAILGNNYGRTAAGEPIPEPAALALLAVGALALVRRRRR